MQETELIPHLFRTEYRKLIAVLCKLLGIEYLEMAEDVVSDTFLQAAETWGQKGIPPQPTAWLYKVAKNKALDVIKRQKIFTDKVSMAIEQNSEVSYVPEIDLSSQNINDSQLQMMFAICHPGITTEAQVGLALNILCGFGAAEIADAFLSNTETIYKRLSRAKTKLKEANITIELPPATEIANRLETVLTTLYLLFNEGYYSSSQNTTLRKDLCIEAMRLNMMLVEHEQTNTPSANALFSLMCFHASRFDARVNADGEVILYEDQDTTLWNKELISKGEFYLNAASHGKLLTRYHLEAAIAYWHTHQTNSSEKWEHILQLYNKLLQIEYSPIAALNRTYALSKANSIAEAITEAEKLKLEQYHLYHTLLGKLYETIDQKKATIHLEKALSLAKTVSDKKHITQMMIKLKEYWTNRE